MARPGITYQDVINAINELKGREKNPTIENIRAILGTGSIGTINMHLKKWKALQNDNEKIAQKENLPPELVALLKGLWEKLLHMSEEKILLSEEKNQKVILELTEELEKYKKNNQRWQQLYNQWLQEKTIYTKEKLTLEEALNLSQEKNIDLIKHNETLTQSTTEKQKRIEELHNLHKQSQINLEHYRESAREQRLLDQENFERQRQELQSQIKIYQDANTDLNKKILNLEKENHTFKIKYEALEKNHEKTSEQYKIAHLNLKDIEKQYQESARMSVHWNDEYKKSQEKLESYNEKITLLQLESKNSIENVKMMKEKLDELSAQNKLLGQDKWMIVQEKAQLEGQLKQLQNMLKPN